MNPGWTTQYDLQVDLVAPTKLTLALGLQPSKELPPPTAGKTDRALGTEQETPTGSTDSRVQGQLRRAGQGRPQGGHVDGAAARPARRVHGGRVLRQPAAPRGRGPAGRTTGDGPLFDDAAATTTGPHLINDSD
mmetsp:Transcript_108345/g.314961  ORF Transcript_108345/g.314961 Transcript_108345/m.314961 type:complete len:134 (+) Transcript_108345:913-1314(+)